MPMDAVNCSNAALARFRSWLLIWHGESKSLRHKDLNGDVHASANQLGTAVAMRICRTWGMPVGVVTTPEEEIDSGFAEPQL